MKNTPEDSLQKVLIAENTDFTDSETKVLPIKSEVPEQKKESTKKQSGWEEWNWLFYSFGGCIFAAIGQFMMDWMSMGFASRFTIALGDFIFVAFYGFAKFLYNSYKKKSFCSFQDSEWCDPKTGKWKEGTFKYLFLCMCCRFGYGFLIIYALYLANDSKMNGGILFSIRTSEALFVAIWTRIFLKEKLTQSKILGLIILIGGVIGLSIPSGSSDEHSGFSILAAILGKN
jgi:drug/metabolite transporter (DMT)-like permease